MGFIERISQEENIRAEQKAAKLNEQEQRLQQEADNKERSKQRSQEAFSFRKESGVFSMIERLSIILWRRTVMNKFNYTGVHASPPDSLKQKDPDSVFDTLYWDETVRSTSGYIHRSAKCIAVETCPDGVIVFHGGWFGSTIILPTNWRIENKEQLFDRALDKAFNHPRIQRSLERDLSSFGGH